MHNFWFRLLVGGVSLYLVLRFFMLPLLPFVIGLSVAVLLEPSVLWLRRHLHFQRKFAAASLVTISLTGLTVLLGVLSWRLFTEAVEFLGKLPELLEGLPSITDEIALRYEGLYDLFPEETHTLLEQGLDLVAQQGAALGGELSAKAIGWGASLVAALPQLTLFLLTTILAVYFISLSYDELLTALKRKIPRKWQRLCSGIATCFRTTFWKWLRAESILSIVTFFISLLGFWYLGSSYALLLAAVVALVDALPVLGAGAVLLPWGLYHVFLGVFPMGIALLTLYGVITLVRSLLEPRVLSREAGLPPLAGLVAVYVGYCLFGIPGMLLMPVFMMFFMQLKQGGYLRNLP